jgi:MarR family transcriptional regulator, lower aerobic nicotinate degradation pathway regulator
VTNDQVLQSSARAPEAIEPRASIGFLIRCAQQAHTQYWSSEFGGELTGPQYAVLAAVGRWPGIDQTRAGELASLDKSSAADVVTRLADVGWLVRDYDVADQRKRVLRLSVPARAALKGITPRVQDVQQRLVSRFSAQDAAEFIRLLARVAYRSPSDLPPEPAEADAEVIGISTSPGHLLRRALQVHTALWGALVGEELTGPQYGVVATLMRHGEMDQKRLGTLASLDKSVVGDVVLRLSRKELLVKERDPADGRRRILRLTEAGRDVLHRVTPGVARVQEALLAPLSEEEAHSLVQELGSICGPEESITSS